MRSQPSVPIVRLGVCALLVTLLHASGQTTYHVATTGSDAANGLSWDTPFLTIHHALSQSSADDAILLASGTYGVTTQIVLDKAVTLRGFGAAGTVVVDAGGTGIGGQNPNRGWPTFSVNAAGARVENLTITGGSDWWTGNGAGMRLEAGTVADCIFDKNYGGNGGALYITGGLVTNCLFSNNGSYLSGGAIYITGGTVTYSTISGNRCDRSNGPTPGGGIYMAGGSVRNCTISNNWSRSSGGGIHMTKGELINTLIVHNELRNYGENADGGGLYMSGGTAKHVTVVGNLAIRGDGDGIYQIGGDVVNSISFFNGESPLTEQADNLYRTGGSVTWSCISPLPAGEGNIQDDPLFFDRDADNYRLHAGSPAIDSGTDAGVMDGREGEVRPQDGGSGSATPDMGCYEAGHPSAVPAFSCDFRANKLEGLSACDVGFTAFAAGPDTDITWYGWDFGNGQTVVGAGLATVTNHYTSGWYTVSLSVSNASLQNASIVKPEYIKVSPVTSYVSRVGQHIPPFQSWKTAATNVRPAVLAAWNDPSCEIIITNGIYPEIGRIDIDLPITIRSVNGAAATTVDGQNLGPNDAGWDVFKLNHMGAVIDGIRIIGGKNNWGGHGAGVLMRDGTLQNCDIDGNYAGYGGGIRMAGGLVTNCLIRNNSAYNNGGGIYITGGLVTHSVFTNNRAIRSNGTTFGGGAYQNGGTITHCTFTDNWARRSGGGLCLISGTLRNSLLVGNEATSYVDVGQGGGIYQTGGLVESCTIADNAAWQQAGDGVWMTGGSILNSIIYHNGNVSLAKTGGGTVNFSTFTPATVGGDGNLNLDPEFQDRGNRDYALRPSSPCIDRGTNQVWMTGVATDLGGALRILTDLVDMGCYEAPDPSAGPLSCNFTADQAEGFTNLTVVFNAVVSGSDTHITNYEWNFGNGNISGVGLATVTNTYPAGYFTVSLSVVNQGSEIASETKTQFIRVYPAISYVAQDGEHVPPFLSWATAATNVQAALDAAYSDGDRRTRVLVSNGTYIVKETLQLIKDITVQSVNGAASTILSANNVDGRRVLTVNSPGAVMEGFTTTKGYLYWSSSGGSVRLDAGTLRHCRIVDNDSGYGAVYMTGGLIEWCDISDNRSYINGGGVYMTGGIVQYCTINKNQAWRSNGTTYGGGVFMTGGILRNCLLTGNTTRSAGGSVYVGGVSASVENCTIVGSSATGYGSTGYGGGVHLANGSVSNTIVYGNQALTDGQDVYQTGGRIGFSCAADIAHDPQGSGNISQLPLFIDAGDNYGAAYSGGNLRLTRVSPCLQTGCFQEWMSTATDLDGEPRVFKSRVDMGCYQTRPLRGSLYILR